MEQEEIREILLAEYDLSQQSGHHQDSLLWNSVSIFLGANLILIGFVISNMGKSGVQSVVHFVGGLGIILTIVVAILVCLRNQVMNINYKICREIEDEMPMVKCSHQRVTRWYEKWKGIQRILLFAGVFLPLVLFWLYVFSAV